MRFATMAVLAALILTARADEVPLDLAVEQQAGQNTAPKGNITVTPGTVGRLDEHDVAFAVRLHNKGMDDLSSVKVTLYIMSSPRAGDINQTKTNLRVTQVLSSDTLAIPAGQDASAVLGKANFKSQSNVSTQTWSDGYGNIQSRSTASYEGGVYRGYVAEIYLDGKLADVRIGNGSMKKAYEGYLANPVLPAPARLSAEPRPPDGMGPPPATP